MIPKPSFSQANPPTLIGVNSDPLWGRGLPLPLPPLPVAHRPTPAKSNTKTSINDPNRVLSEALRGPRHGGPVIKTSTGVAFGASGAPKRYGYKHLAPPERPNATNISIWRLRNTQTLRIKAFWAPPERTHATNTSIWRSWAAMSLQTQPCLSLPLAIL